MIIIKLYLVILLLFNCYILNVHAENKYYLVSIRRNSNDEEYDKANEKVQNSIDELVNDRMNDIYDIIIDHKESYIEEDGKMDEKLEELEEASNLKKRDVNNNNKKFKFINKNRPYKDIKKTKRMNEYKNDDKNDLEWIPFESSLVVHICPVLNYYVIIAYLSEEVVEKIKKLPNVIACSKAKKLKNKNAVPLDTTETDENPTDKYYNRKEILEETKWKDLNVQEHEFSFTLKNSHLSLISQDKYNKTFSVPYDNNYYYPSSAGKGIDVYVIDDGLDTSYYEEDFDTYADTPDERIVQCDCVIYDGENHPPVNITNCNTYVEDTINHGTLVALSAVGKVNGVAKKANLHMVAIDFESFDILVALDHVKQNATPHKTVLNISAGCYNYEEGCEEKTIQDKIDELVNTGIIIVVAAGNTGTNVCSTDVFTGAKGVICVGAINNSIMMNSKAIDESLESMYEISDYSSYGECLELFAPGTIRVLNSTSDEVIYENRGTSFSSPIVAGVASLIMSENPDIEYDFESMKKVLIDLSLKDVIVGLDNVTPNRLINNGKRSIYGPPRCDDPSGKYHCKDKCCSKYGLCIDPNTTEDKAKSLCHDHNGCIYEYGVCESIRCGKNYYNRKCLQNECCSKNGECVNIYEDYYSNCFMDNECIEEFSDVCLPSDTTTINQYDEKYHELIYNHSCEKELESFSSCTFTNYFSSSFYEKHDEICNNYKINNCTQFLDSPLEYVPVCGKTNQSTHFYSNKSKISLDKLLCAVKNSTDTSNEFCFDSSKKIFNLLYGEPDFELYCPYEECRQSIIQYFKVLYNETLSTREFYEKEGGEEQEISIIDNSLNIISKNLEFLSSKYCIGNTSDENSSTVTFDSDIDKKTKEYKPQTTATKPSTNPTSAQDSSTTEKDIKDNGAFILYLYPKYIYQSLLIVISLTLIILS